MYAVVLVQTPTICILHGVPCAVTAYLQLIVMCNLLRPTRLCNTNQRGKPDEPLKPVPSAGDGGENTAHRRSSGYCHDHTVVEGEVSGEQDGGNGGQRGVLQRMGSSVHGRMSSRALRVSSRQVREEKRYFTWITEL